MVGKLGGKPMKMGFCGRIGGVGSLTGKGLFLLVRPGGGAADRAGAYRSTPVELPTGR